MEEPDIVDIRDSNVEREEPQPAIFWGIYPEEERLADQEV